MPSLNSVAVTLYDTQVKQAYQARKSLLMQAVTLRQNVEGSVYNFRKMTSGVSSLRGAPSSDIIPMNNTHSLIACTLADYYAADLSDVFGQAKVNFDEVNELATTIAAAIERRKDQIVIDTLDALTSLTTTAAPSTTQATTISTDFGTPGSNLTLQKILRAGALLDKREVPTEDRFWLAHTNQKESLMQILQATSGDFRGGVKPLETGAFNNFYGFNFIFVGDRAEGGIDRDGSFVRNNYAFDRRAVGMAVGALSENSEINYIPMKMSWLVAQKYSAQSAAIDTGGIIRVLCTEDASA